MSDFQRGLTPSFFETLRRLAEATEPNWWKDLLALWSPSGTSLHGRPLRMAVRSNYLNFYLKGQSVARVEINRAGKPVAAVHVKYAFDDEEAQAYAKLTDGEVLHPKSGKSVAYDGLATLSGWMRRAADWETAEKAEVERVVSDNEHIIDLEMGLPAHGEQKTALRMDVVALEPHGGGASIVFWEAKRVSDGRLKSRSDRPEVMSQIDAYRNYLSDEGHRDAVIKAYRETCRMLSDFAEMAGSPGAVSALVQSAATDVSFDLIVDREPRLVIFGSAIQLASADWKKHENKLHGLRVPMLMVKTDAYRLSSYVSASRAIA